MGVASRQSGKGIHLIDCRVLLIRGVNVDTNSGHGIVWWWSML